MHAHTPVCACTCMHNMHRDTCTHVHTHMHTHTCSHTHTHARMHTHTHTHMHTHTYTHTHTFSPPTPSLPLKENPHRPTSLHSSLPSSTSSLVMSSSPMNCWKPSSDSSRLAQADVGTDAQQDDQDGEVDVETIRDDGDHVHVAHDLNPDKEVAPKMTVRLPSYHLSAQLKRYLEKSTFTC